MHTKKTVYSERKEIGYDYIIIWPIGDFKSMFPWHGAIVSWCDRLWRYLSGSVFTPTMGLSSLKTWLATSSIVPSPEIKSGDTTNIGSTHTLEDEDMLYIGGKK